MKKEFICPECGSAHSVSLPDWYNLDMDIPCPACSEKAEFARKEADRKEKIRQSFLNRWRDSQLDRFYMGFDPDHPEANRELFRQVSEVYRTDSLFISEQSGTGKTRIIQHFARELMQKEEISVYYSTWVDLCDELAALAKSDRGRIAFMKHIRTRDLLIIDDLGKESPSPARSAALWQILDSRYVANQMRHAGRSSCYGWRLWCTTQLSSDELLQRFSGADGTAIIRRIINTCHIFSRKTQSSQI